MPRPRSRRRLAGPPSRHHEETSAGGLVVDVTGATRAALIARYGREGRLRGSLPKGHVEGEETIEEAAVREVEEELLSTGGILSDADLKVAEVAWFPLAEVAGGLAHADERRLVTLVPELLAGVT